MELKEIVLKLTGPVEPVGETHTDNARYENLKKLIEVAKEIHMVIDGIAENENRQEFSMKRAGKEASDYLDWLGIPE